MIIVPVLGVIIFVAPFLACYSCLSGAAAAGEHVLMAMWDLLFYLGV